MNEENDYIDIEESVKQDKLLEKIESQSKNRDRQKEKTINPRRLIKRLEKSYLRLLTIWNTQYRTQLININQTYEKEKKFLLLNAVGNLHEYFQKDFPPGWKDRNVGIKSYEKNPVVLLHGFGNNRGVFIDMAEKLREHGFELVYRLNHNPWTDIKKNIRLINSRIDQILAQTKPKSGKVDLIGHSLGGLTARYYSYIYPEKVEYCLMLGAPHKGTYLAYAGLLGFLIKPLLKKSKIEGMSAFQMTPGGKFLNEINAMRPAPNVKYINIYSDTDELILYKDSPVVKGHVNINVKTDAGIDGIGHGGLIHDPQIIDLICEILNNTYGKEAQLRFYEDYDEDYKQIIPVRG